MSHDSARFSRGAGGLPRSASLAYLARIGVDVLDLFRLIWRGRYALAALGLVFGAVGLWRGLTAPAYYESFSVVSLKSDPSRTAAYNLGRFAAKEYRIDHFFKMITTREVLEDVVRRAGIRPELLPGLAFDPARPPSAEVAAEYMARRLVRVRLIKNQDGPFAANVWVRAGDSALARDVSRLLVQAADARLQEKVREDARAMVGLLKDQMLRTSNPDLRARLQMRIAQEEERSVVAGPVAAEIWQQPQVPEHRVEPRRKVLLGLSLFLATVLGCWLLVARDADARRRYFSLRLPLFPAADKTKGVWAPVAVCVLFMILYNVAFKVMPSFATPRMAMTLLFLVACRHKLQWVFEDIHENLGMYLIFFSVFAYAMGLYFLGGDKDAASIVAEFIYAPLLGTHLYLRFIGYDWKRFHAYIMWAVLIQAVLHIYSLFSVDYRTWLAGIVQQTGNWDLTYASSPPGFSSGAAASFSVVQSLGVISSMIRLREGTKPLASVLCILTVVLSVVSAVISGRTGLLIAVFFIAVFTLTGGSKIRIPVLAIFGILLSLFFVYFEEIRFLATLISPDLGWRLNSIVGRASEPFTMFLKSTSIQQFSDMTIPALRVETILGTGFFRSIFDGRHDSAYVQLYYALGLPMVILYYGAMLGFFVRRMLLYRAVETTVKWVLPCVVLIAFLIETKEHLITKGFGIYAFALVRLLYRPPPAGTDAPPEGGTA